MSSSNQLPKRVTFASSVKDDDNHIKGFKFQLFKVCRIVFALTILADVLWYFASFEVRSAYFKDLGIPILLIYVIIAVYTFFGIRLLLNLGLESTCLGMVITYAIVGFVVHHPVGSGGIGDYPKYLHGEMNFKQVLSYQALIGGLLVLMGFPDMMKRKKIMHGTISYSMVLGRAMIAIHFILQTLYFKIYQYSRLSKHLQLLGKNSFVYIFVIGLIHLFGSYFAWLGRTASQRKKAALALALTTAAIALAEQADPASGISYQMKLEAKIHYLIVQTGIATGCLLLYSIGGLNALPYKHAAD